MTQTIGHTQLYTHIWIHRIRHKQ